MTSATVVEMLNVFSRSPPVPQTSMIVRERVSASSGGAMDMARRACAKAAISSAVSPLRASAVRKSALTSAVALSPVNSSTASRNLLVRQSLAPGHLFGQRRLTRWKV